MGCGAIMALAGAAPAWANDADSADAAAEEQRRNEIVVTATATGVDLYDAPASISVITREEIERQPVQSLAELLGRLPGVTGGISPTGAMSKITIRGLPDNYTLMLVDGRRIGNSRDISYRPDLGRQDLNWISPDMIERIEVVRGPMSSLYGSDAMGGVINIITRPVAPSWRGSFNGSITLPENSERGETYQAGVNMTGPITKTLGLRIGGTYSRTNADEVLLSNNNGAAGTVSKNVNAVLTWRAAEGHIFSAEGSYGLEDPLNPSFRNAAGNIQGAFGSKTKRTSLRASYEGKWGSDINSRLDVYHNAFNNDDMTGNNEAKFNETIVDGLVNFSANVLTEHKIAVGGQYRKEELTNTDTIGTVPVDYSGNVVSGATLSGHTWALFAEDQIVLVDGLNLTVGGRLDSHHRYGEHFSPRGYLVWHPIDGLTLRGGVSKGFRAPSLKENSAGAATNSGGNGCTSLRGGAFRDNNGNPYTTGACWMAGNPDLKPEESTNYEAGVSYENKIFDFSATYFHTNFKNKIQYAPLGWFEGRWWTKNENVQRARTKGLELTGSVRIIPEVKIRANATYMIQAKNLDTGANLITTPKWSAFGAIDVQPIERLTLNMTARYTGKQLGGGSTIENANTIFDLNGAFEVAEPLTVRAGVMNLFKKEITGSTGSGYYSPLRRFFIGITARF
ncbi:MAG: TonB-dependent receptor [Sphingobium sp.]|nr:TonB-dependent receptor [Sphingobium sp.]